MSETKRYEFELDNGPSEDSDGYYMVYDDHLKAMAAKDAEIERLKYAIELKDAEIAGINSRVKYEQEGK